MFRSLISVGFVIFIGSTASHAMPSESTSECHLLELAYKVTLAQKDVAYKDILVDCPGYENWEFEMSIHDSGKAFHLARNVPLPDKVRQGGAPARLVFQAMISRGVPLDIAQAMVDTRAFEKAVKGRSE